MTGGLSAAHCEHGHYRGQGCVECHPPRARALLPAEELTMTEKIPELTYGDTEIGVMGECYKSLKMIDREAQVRALNWLHAKLEADTLLELAKTLMARADAILDSLEAKCDQIEATGDLAKLEAMSQWQPIETAPKDVVALFLVRAGTWADSKWFANTSGSPIFGGGPTRIHMGRYGTWSSLSVATHWAALPDPPSLCERGEK
jgi:hypothetical protein